LHEFQRGIKKWGDGLVDDWIVGLLNWHIHPLIQQSSHPAIQWGFGFSLALDK
jgi:hypothetical protein